MLLPLISIVAAQAADLLTFIALVMRRGTQAEANPLVSRVLEQYGLPLATLGKVALILLVVSTMVVLAGHQRRQRYPRLAAVVAGIAVLSGLIGAYSNVFTLRA